MVTADAPRRRTVRIAFSWIALAGLPALAAAGGDGGPVIGPGDLAFEIPAVPLSEDGSVLDDGFLTFDRLPRGSPVEDRIALYEEGLEWLAAAGGGDRERRPPTPGFVDVFVDYAALADPEDALAAARRLAPREETAALYEALGVSLLSAARQDRLGGDLESAGHRLEAAQSVFDLADRGAADGEPDPCGGQPFEPDLVPRAMVALERYLIGDSSESWGEAADLLTLQLEIEPSGPRADWALRMLRDPATYLGEEPALLPRRPFHVGGDIRKPRKIFAPPPPYTSLALKGRVQGVVIIQAVIDRHGNVAALELLKGLPMGLSDEALRTMFTWLFEPATLDGQPIVVFYNLTMSFRM